MTIKFKWIPQTQQRFVCIRENCVGKLDTIHTMLDDHILLLKKAIAEKNADKLFDYLIYDAQLSDISSIRAGGWNSNGSRNPQAYYMETCPVIEALLLKHPKELAKLIQDIISAADNNLYHALVKSLQTACLPQNLMEWNVDIKRKIQEDLNSVKQYGITLGEKEYRDQAIHNTARDKSKKTAALVISLETTLNNLLTNKFNYADKECLLAELPKYLADLIVLKFKLEFSDLLHTQDAVLNNVIDVTPFAAANTASIVAFGIPGLINLAMNGSFFFYNKPQSQQNIENLANTVLPVYRR